MVVSKLDTSPKQIIHLVNSALANEIGQRETDIGSSSAGRKPEVRRTVVLFEADDDMRAMISLLLKRSGYQVIPVLTQDDMIRLAKSDSVDLFLMDQGRGHSAVSSCQRIRTEFPNTPVAVYSTRALPAEKEEVIRAGASQYLNSAEDLLQVAEICANLINNARESRETSPA